MRYNERIREIREDNPLTQQKVADLLHVGQRTYADYESGKTRIPVDSHRGNFRLSYYRTLRSY